MQPIPGFENTGHYRKIERACGAFQTARELVRAGVTMADADAMYRHGRISGDVQAWLTLANHWCAVRLSSERQDRAYARIGADGVARRIARVRRMFGLA